MTYNQKLVHAINTSGSCLCVGLDPNLELIPPAVAEDCSSDTETVLLFLRHVIDATSDHCAAYKPNLGFFEALGAGGWDVFREILDYIPNEKIIIADAKRGDISSTAEHYAKAFFKKFDVDAVTLNPLMGFETLSPFLNNKQKAVYVLTLTSNPGSADLLTKPIGKFDTVASYIAHRLKLLQENSSTDVGMVVGATKTDQLGPVIRQFPKATLLIPGIGKQGGTVSELWDVLQHHQGVPLINSSRSIIYAGKDTREWQKAVADKALKMKNKLRPLIQNVG